MRTSLFKSWQRTFWALLSLLACCASALQGQTWTISVIDNNGNVGQYSSLTMSPTGELWLTYYDATNQKIKYARKSGSSWSVNDLRPGVSSGAWSSISVDDIGRPSVVFTNPATSEVKYIGWLPLPPTADISVIDASGNPGSYSSLTTDASNNLALTYAAQTSKQVRLAKKTGASWTIQNLFTSTSTPSWSSLGYDQSNRPSVVLNDPVTSEVKYIGWLPLPPTADISVIDASGNPGTYSSLTTDASNNLALTYVAQTPKQVRLAKKVGSSWAIQSLFTSTSTPSWSSLGYDQSNRPSVVLTDPTTSEVKYLGWLPTPPSAQIEVVDATGNVGQNGSMIFGLNGRPLVSYYDATNQDLKLAYKSQAGWGKQTVDATGNVGNASSVQQNANGVVGIAYNDVTNSQVKYSSAFFSSGDYTISGTVVDKITNQPITGATVVTRELGATTSTSSAGIFISFVTQNSGYSLEISARNYLRRTISNIAVGTQNVQLGNIQLEAIVETEYDLVELNPNPNPAISQVEVGGTFMRYYQVKGRQSGVEANEIEVDFAPVGSNVATTFVSRNYQGTDGIVQVRFSAEAAGCTQCSKAFVVRRIHNNTNPNSPLGFGVEVKARKYSKIFEIDRNIDIDLGVAIGAKGSVGIGEQTLARFILEESDGNTGSPDSMRVEEETQAKAGVEVGIGIGAKLGGRKTGAGVYGGLSGGLYAILLGEGKYHYAYDTPAEPMQRLAKLLNVSRLALTLAPLPIVGAVVSYLSNNANWNYLERAEAGLGVKGEGSASLLGGVFTSRQWGAGLSGVGEIQGTVTARMGYDKIVDDYYGRMTLSGSIGGSLGFGFMFWKFEEPGRPKTDGVNLIKKRSGWGGSESGQIQLFGSRTYGGFSLQSSLRRSEQPSIEFMSIKGTDGWEKRTSFRVNNSDLPQLLEGTAYAGLFSLCRESAQIVPLSTVKRDFLKRNLDEAFGTFMERQYSNAWDPIHFTTDSAGTSTSGGFNIDFDWDIAVKIKLDNLGISWRTARRAVAERGVYRGFGEYVLEQYADIPAIPISAQDALTKIFRDGFSAIRSGEILSSKILFHRNSLFARSLVDTTVLLAPIGSMIRLNPSGFPPTLDSLSCQTWNWYGNSTQAKMSDLPREKREVALAIKAQQQALARLDYGIGGFYKFSPQPVPLTSPATLTIVYPDSDVVGIDESQLAIFQQDTVSSKWRYVGGVVNPDSNRIRVDVDTLQLYTIAPIMPDGAMGLNSDVDTLQNDSISLATIWSDSLKLSNGELVGNNIPYTIRAENVGIVAADADTSIEGIQVNSVNSRVEFQVRSSKHPGKATIRVESVYGAASGLISLTIRDTVKPAPPTITHVLRGDQEIRLVVTKPDTSDIGQYEILYATQHGPPYNGRSLAGGLNSPFTVPVGDTITVSLLPNDTLHYFAIRGIDAANNLSDYSNEVTGTPHDSIPPGSIRSMDFTRMTDSSYLARWYASGDNGNTGRASKYYLKMSNQPVADTASWWSTATDLTNVTAPNDPDNYDYHVIPGLQDSTYKLGIRVEDEVGLQSTISIFSITEKRATRGVTLASGWNLISHPIESNERPLTLYPHLGSGPYAFSQASGYSPSDTLKKLAGYWIKVAQGYDKNFNGTLINDTIVTVTQGWNLIGANSSTTQVSDIHSVPSGIITSQFYGYDSSNGHYPATSVRTGSGYWVKVSQNGSIALPREGASAEKIATGVIPQKGFVVAGADLRERRLWLVQDREVARFDAPPLPPSGILDVRYNSDRYGESETSASYEIQITHGQYPLVISLNNMGDDQFDVTGAITQTQYGALGGSRLLRITDSKDTHILLTKISVPGEYYLSQNYPNPFNPKTTIKFGLPEKQLVTMKVFDIVGREVTTLASKLEMKPGHHKIEWDATNYATGVYFVRMQAGPYTSVKKMLLLK